MDGEMMFRLRPDAGYEWDRLAALLITISKNYTWPISIGEIKTEENSRNSSCS
jgi:hypothetical protein